MNQFKKVIFVLSFLFILAGYVSAADWKPEIKFFKIGTGSTGGTWYPQGAIIADTINKTLAPLSASVAPGGAVSNVTKLDRNELQMAMTYMALEGLAWEGKDPYQKPHKNIRHIASMVPYAVTFVVRGDSGINSISDLKNKKIVVGAKGFISELFARKILEAYGITYEDIKKNGGLVSFLNYKEGAELLQDKHTDMVTLMAIHPSSLLMGLSTQTKIKFLGIEPNMMKKILAENKGMIEMTVPDKPGTYGVEKVVAAIGGTYGYLVNKDLSEELVYRVTKIIYEKMGEISKAVSKDLETVTVKTLDLGAAIPLHPGAERYFKEQRKK